jgi:hypothetical protein
VIRISWLALIIMVVLEKGRTILKTQYTLEQGITAFIK